MSQGAAGGPGGWQAHAPGAEPCSPLIADAEADVVIIGAGYSGLWTAWHLLAAEPELRVIVLEARRAGFGASGRNGGWLQGVVPGDLARWERRHGLQLTRRAQQVCVEAVDEIVGVLEAEQIEAHQRAAGAVRIARSAAEEQRIRAAAVAARHWGWPASGLRELTGAETAERIAARGARAALLQEPCATVDPARLVHGLLAAVLRRGAVVHEGSEVVAIEPGRSAGGLAQVRTRAGACARAPRVVLATEAFTVQLPGLGRRYLPLASTVIATAQLSAEADAELGWAGGEAVGDAQHLFFYAQHTADRRVVLGGRGAPYRLGSAINVDGAADAATVARLEATLGAVWPQLAGTPIEHRWSGSLAVPRDWCASCGVDRESGIAWIGGYAGHGVAAAYVLARSLAPLLRGRADPLGAMPWTLRRARGWEPEPLRWLAAQTIVRALGAADRREAAGGGGRVAQLAKPFLPAS